MSSFVSKLLRFLAKKIVSKARKAYQKKYNKKLPVILVVGTVGKSSQTLLLKGLFEKEGYRVFSGGSVSKNLNSLTGIGMVFGDFFLDFEGRNRLVNKVKYITKSLKIWLLKRFKFDEKTIVIYETGFDHIGEADEFVEVFDKAADLVIITNLTHEHAENFPDKFDKASFQKIQKYLPDQWRETLEDEEIEGRLKNTALEQFKMLACADKFIIPKSLGYINNLVLENLSGKWSEHLAVVSRGENFCLVADKTLKFNDNYLLPKTFGKFLFVSKLVAKEYGIKLNDLKKFLKIAELPNGRFNLFEGIKNTTVVDSTYNSDPASLSSFLDLFEEVVAYYVKAREAYFENERKNKMYREGSPLRKELDLIDPPKHYLVFGEMRELGEIATREHRLILDRILELAVKWEGYIENVYLLGSEWLKCDEQDLPKMDGKVSFISHKKQLFKVFKRVGDICEVLNEETIRPNSWCWVKGSQNTIFLEVLVESLLKDKRDASKLSRRGKGWDLQRKNWK